MDIRPGSTLQGPNGEVITIRRVIGKGGFGQVLEGELPDGALVAIKTVLTTTLSDDELRTLQNEIALAREVSHPNVVRVLHVSDGRATTGVPPYLVMELVTGGNLRGFLEDRRTKKALLSPDELRAMYQQLASGMAAISARLVHRDLKPENVLIDGASGALKISDFGLAKLATAATRSETFKGWGTPPYMAPEAFDGTANTAAMDVYAMGVIFHELAALDLPIVPKSGDYTAIGWARAHLIQAPANLGAVRSDLPHDLQQLVLQMLQKDPAKRPTNWSQVLGRLQAGSITAVPGTPDVSKLVERATARFQESVTAEAREREARARREERRAILELAAREPLDLLRGVVEAFNAATTVGKLTHSENGLGAQVSAAGQPKRLRVGLQIVDDIEAQPDGIVRIIGMVSIQPGPTAREADATRHDLERFSGFNLAYWAPSVVERYGTWRQYRFEHHPLLGFRSASRWFALPLERLACQVTMLRGATEYQHEERGLDDVWVKDLLAQLL